MPLFSSHTLASIVVQIFWEIASIGVVGLWYLPADAQQLPSPESEPACKQAYEAAPWKKTLYVQPALALGMGDNWRMVIRGNQLAEIYITDYDGRCWDINQNPMASGSEKIESFWQGYPGKPDGGERYHYHVVVEHDQLMLVQTDKESCRLGKTLAQDPALVGCVPVANMSYVLGVRKN